MRSESYFCQDNPYKTSIQTNWEVTLNIYCSFSNSPTYSAPTGVYLVLCEERSQACGVMNAFVPHKRPVYTDCGQSQRELPSLICATQGTCQHVCSGQSFFYTIPIISSFHCCTGVFQSLPQTSIQSRLTRPCCLPCFWFHFTLFAWDFPCHYIIVIILRGTETAS